MRAKDVQNMIGYTPDELVLKNVLTVGDFPADIGAEIYCHVGWSGTQLSITGGIDGQEVILLLDDDQVKSLIDFWNSFEEKRTANSDSDATGG